MLLPILALTTTVVVGDGGCTISLTRHAVSDAHRSPAPLFLHCAPSAAFIFCLSCYEKRAVDECRAEYLVRCCGGWGSRLLDRDSRDSAGVACTMACLLAMSWFEFKNKMRPIQNHHNYTRSTPHPGSSGSVIPPSTTRHASTPLLLDVQSTLSQYLKDKNRANQPCQA